MQYISTRAGVPPADFREVLLGGLAADGGLFVPEEFPVLDFNQIAGTARHSEMGRPEMSYPEIAAEVMHPYLEGFIERDEFLDLTAQAYKDFTHPKIAPLVYVEEFDFYLLELFYGPTLAFKDMALQLVGALFEYALQKSDGDHSTILTATSGDTGAAAIYACLGKNNLSAYVLHPEGLVSDIQRRMMTSVSSSNIKNIAIKGNFDDCQNLVKDLFQDSDLANLNLTAMNSINWARISAQAVYYFWAVLQLEGADEGVTFCVPSGNFGNIYSGWVAAQMGAPIKKLIAAVNKNDTLARFINTGELVSKSAVPTLAPSMDVSIPSNLERLIFEMLGRVSTEDFYASLNTADKGPNNADKNNLSQNLKNFWSAYSIEDESGRYGGKEEGIDGGIRGIIQKIKDEAGLWIDPHTAVGVGGLLQAREEEKITGPQIVLSTAHPSKFEELYASEDDPPALPENFSDLKSREENYVILPPSSKELKDYVLSTQIN